MRKQRGGGAQIDSLEQRNSMGCGAARHRWGVILAGGDGKRLQPLTRLACGDNRPKQFCPLLGGETLLAHTRHRISRAMDDNHILYVLTAKHEPFYRAELSAVPEVDSPENTTPSAGPRLIGAALLPSARCRNDCVSSGLLGQ